MVGSVSSFSSLLLCFPHENEIRSTLKFLNFFYRHYELISAHGYPDCQMTIWKYPSMEKQCELTGHTERLMQMVMTPDGFSVMTSSADETLRLWNCFAPDLHPANKKKSSIKHHPSLLRPNIR